MNIMSNVYFIWFLLKLVAFFFTLLDNVTFCNVYDVI